MRHLWFGSRNSGNIPIAGQQLELIANYEKQVWVFDFAASRLANRGSTNSDCGDTAILSALFWGESVGRRLHVHFSEDVLG